MYLLEFVGYWLGHGELGNVQWTNTPGYQLVNSQLMNN